MTAVNVTTGGAGYTAPTVVFSGGAATPVDVAVGNVLQDRAFATDYSVAPTILQPTATVDPVDSAIYDVALGTATGGTFDLTIDSIVTTVAWNATAAELEAALSANGITATVTGSWHIVFATAPVDPVLGVDGGNLTQPSAPPSSRSSSSSRQPSRRAT